MVKARWIQWLVCIAVLLYIAATYTVIEQSSQRVIAEIREADGLVSIRPLGVLGWRTCDRVESVIIPESLVRASPELVRALRRFPQLESVVINVSLPIVGKRQIQANDGRAALAKYYAFVDSGRTIHMTSSAVD